MKKLVPFHSHSHSHCRSHSIPFHYLLERRGRRRARAARAVERRNVAADHRRLEGYGAPRMTSRRYEDTLDKTVRRRRASAPDVVARRCDDETTPSTDARVLIDGDGDEEDAPSRGRTLHDMTCHHITLHYDDANAPSRGRTPPRARAPPRAPCRARPPRPSSRARPRGARRIQRLLPIVVQTPYPYAPRHLSCVALLSSLNTDLVARGLVHFVGFEVEPFSVDEDYEKV